MTYEQIYAKVASIDPETLTAEERAVMSVLFPPFRARSGEKYTQQQIAKEKRWLGCHPEHEADIVADKMETTTRQVRAIIRKLRLERGVPILSDTKGYWIATSGKEADEYMARLELMAKAQAIAWTETYKAMRLALSVKQRTFFEGLDTVDQDEVK